MRFSGSAVFKIHCIVGVEEFARGRRRVGAAHHQGRRARLYEHDSVYSILEEKFIRLDSQNPLDAHDP